MGDALLTAGGAASSPPSRTCVGCRIVDQKARLVRCVSDTAGRLVIDARARLDGRGVYLHPRRECTQAAIKRGALPRSLHRRLVTVDAEELFSRLVAARPGDGADETSRQQRSPGIAPRKERESRGGTVAAGAMEGEAAPSPRESTSQIKET